MWVRVYISGGYTYLIDFIEWFGYWMREGVFFLYPLFLFLLVLLVYDLYTLHIFCPFINTISYL